MASGTTEFFWKKQMKKILLSTKEVKELLSISESSFPPLHGFPRPVDVRIDHDVYLLKEGKTTTETYRFPRNLYRAKDVLRWAKKLGYR